MDENEKQTRMQILVKNYADLKKEIPDHIVIIKDDLVWRILGYSAITTKRLTGVMADNSEGYLNVFFTDEELPGVVRTLLRNLYPIAIGEPNPDKKSKVPYVISFIIHSEDDLSSFTKKMKGEDNE